jgi:formamidopyrimidine-DNA glycosylase
MPELPEVEVTRAALAPALEGAVVQGMRLGKPLRWPLGIAAERLRGARIGPVARRGKYLWLPLMADGGGNGAGGGAGGGLLWHLGMSGSLAFHASAAAPGAHDHADLVTERGTLRLTDPRRFGAVLWSPSREEGLAGRLLAGLGSEPFDERFTAAAFRRALRERRAAVKSVLLAGNVIVGAGNIYACEALYLAGIDPRTPSHRIGPLRAQRLLDALRRVLRDAIAAGGSTLRDFRDPHGAAGDYQARRHVYDREGQPCPRCGATVRRVVLGQRSTYFCPGCQRR